MADTITRLEAVAVRTGEGQTLAENNGTRKRGNKGARRLVNKLASHQVSAAGPRWRVCAKVQGAKIHSIRWWSAGYNRGRSIS